MGKHDKTMMEEFGWPILTNDALNKGPRNDDDDDEDDDDLPFPPRRSVVQVKYLPSIRVVSQRILASEFTISLGDIKVREEPGLNEVLGLFRNAGPNDIIRIYISSNGGSVFTCLRILNAMRDTQATVITVGDGYVHSAASFVLLSGDIIEIKDYCSMLVHDASGTVGGKFSDINEEVIYNKQMRETLFNDIYSGFLTNDEILNLLRGMDFRFHSSDIIERLYKMKPIREAKTGNELLIINELPEKEVVEEPKVKKTKKAKTDKKKKTKVTKVKTTKIEKPLIVD